MRNAVEDKVREAARVRRMPGVQRALVAVLCLIALQAGLAAQEGQGARGRGQGPPGETMVSPAEIQRMLDGYMLIQAEKMLQLTDEQFPNFLSRLRVLQETRRRTQGERQRALQELRRLTSGRGGPIDEAAIKKGLETLDDAAARAAAEIKQQQAAIDQVLSLVQQARFRIFEETIEQRKLELLMRARQASRGRQPQPGQVQP